MVFHIDPLQYVSEKGPHVAAQNVTFRGISASLFGMTETVIFFLIYEELKKTVVRRQTDESLRKGSITSF